jgi:hypothetical protein
MAGEVGIPRPVRPVASAVARVESRRNRRKAADRQLTASIRHGVSRIPDVPVWVCVAVAFVGSCAGAASAFVGGGGRSVPWPGSGLRSVWPGSGDSGAQLVGLLGIALVVATWLALGVAVLRHRTGVRGVLGFSIAATLPLALAPPLFSEDAWTYVAIGQLVERGFDPYRVGWGVLGNGSYTANLSLFWRDTPSPYSPLALRLLQVVAHSVHGSLAGGTVELRVLALVAIAATIPLLLALTSSRRLSQGPVLWLVVANPLLIVTLVSSIHLDVLVLPLMLAAVLLERRGHLVYAVAAAALAGQVKVTALVVVGFVVAARLFIAREDEPTARRVRAAAGLAAIGAGVFAGINLACGLGFGWARELGIPGRANNVFTPLDALTDLASAIGIGPGPQPGQVVATAPTWLTDTGLALGLAVTAVLAINVGRLGVARGTAYSLMVLTLLNGAVWPWYFCVPFVLLVLFGHRREQLVVVVLSTVLTFSVRPDSAGGAGGGFRAAALIGDVFFLIVYVIAGILLTRRTRIPGADPQRL